MRDGMLKLVLAAVLTATAMPAAAQVRTVDPNTAIDADLRAPTPPPARAPLPGAPSAPVRAAVPDQQWQDVDATPPTGAPDSPPVTPAARGISAANVRPDNVTYGRDDLIGAAEGVFGRGAQGLAGIIERILRDQGRPNAYIAGREASGALVVGLRYGSGTLTHRVEGQRSVFWTGPSVGFDVGGDAAKVFVLAYNLYDTQDIYKRFAAAEGRAYFVSGFSATYLRRGNVVLIPVRLGVGWRLGANVGYMKITERSRWLPF